jgi:hypothetical protein
MYFKPTGPLTMGGVFTASWRLCRLSFRQCRPLALLAAAQSVLLALWLQQPTRVFTSVWKDALLRLDLPALDASGVQFVRAAGGPVCISVLLCALLLAAMMVPPLALAAGERAVGALQALRAAAYRLHRLVLGSVLTVLLVGSGLVLLLVPGVYWFGRVQLWFVPVLAEDASAPRAIGRSWELTRGHWWRVSTLLSVALALVCVGWAAGAWIGTELGARAAPWLRAGVDPAWLLATLLANASCVVTLPYLCAMLVVLYDDLEMRAMLADARRATP